MALCGRSAALRTELLAVHRLELVSYESCIRTSSHIEWSPTVLEPFLREATEQKMAVLKIHSHPTGYPEFSETDDASDRNVFESVYGWVEGDRPHLSAIMLPDGRVLARAVLANGTFSSVESVAVVGHDLRLWFAGEGDANVPEFAQRHAQLFGEGTTRLLGRLRVAIVGCSGTGSPVIEQLVRLGVRELILIDPDCVEERNLNRILGATMEDAVAKRPKVDVLARHIRSIGLGTSVIPIRASLEEAAALRAVAVSDVVIGCVDSLCGRNLLCRAARYFTLPYVDVGVKLEALPDGTINQVAGSVHFIRPDGADLLDRGVFTSADLEAEDLWKTNPEEYRDRLRRGYIRGVAVDRPAVISVNMTFAGFAVTELLARLHPFRMEPNASLATTRLSLSHLHLENDGDRDASSRARLMVGRGDAEPPLGMPKLSRSSEQHLG